MPFCFHYTDVLLVDVFKTYFTATEYYSKKNKGMGMPPIPLL